MTPQLRYVLRLADSSLVLAQRLGEWVGHAPALEEDLGLANVSLDLLGQARLLLAHAGELEGKGRGEDQLAYLRGEPEFLNLTLVEQPNGDFGQTIARQFLFDAWQLGMYEAMQQSADARLAAIAAKALKETRYHLRYSGGWLVRLGDGTDASQCRAQAALDWLLPFTDEFWTASTHETEARDNASGVDMAALRADWQALVNDALAEATLTRPAAQPGYVSQGKQGLHSEHLGYLLAEMQSLARAHPGATW